MRISGSDCATSKDASDRPAKTLILIVSSLRVDESRDKPALRLCDRGANSNRREQQQHGQLRYLERRVRLSRRHSAQCRNPAKELDDQHENIEIQRHHGRDRIGPAPDPLEMVAIDRKTRDYQHGQREDAQNLGRGEAVKWEEEARQARRRRRRQEGLSPSIGRLCFQQSVERADARTHSDQTQDDIKSGEGIQDHGSCISLINPRPIQRNFVSASVVSLVFSSSIQWPVFLSTITVTSRATDFICAPRTSPSDFSPPIAKTGIASGVRASSAKSFAA